MTTKEDCMYRAFQVAQRSSCARRRVGAVIAEQHGDDYRIVSEGWNHHVIPGVSCEAKFFADFSTDKSSGLNKRELKKYLTQLKKDPLAAHLLESSLSPKLAALWSEFKVFTKTEDFKKLHWDFMGDEIHSEIHAIINGYKNGKLATCSNAVLFSSRSPCQDCAKATIETGVIKKVFYTETSLKGLSGGLSLLDKAITIEHLDFKSPFYT